MKANWAYKSITCLRNQKWRVYAFMVYFEIDCPSNQKIIETFLQPYIETFLQPYSLKIIFTPQVYIENYIFSRNILIPYLSLKTKECMKIIFSFKVKILIIKYNFLYILQRKNDSFIYFQSKYDSLCIFQKQV